MPQDFYEVMGTGQGAEARAQAVEQRGDAPRICIPHYTAYCKRKKAAGETPDPAPDASPSPSALSVVRGMASRAVSWVAGVANKRHRDAGKEEDVGDSTAGDEGTGSAAGHSGPRTLSSRDAGALLRPAVEAEALLTPNGLVRRVNKRQKKHDLGVTPARAAAEAAAAGAGAVPPAEPLARALFPAGPGAGHMPRPYDANDPPYGVVTVDPRLLSALAGSHRDCCLPGPAGVTVTVHPASGRCSWVSRAAGCATPGPASTALTGRSAHERAVRAVLSGATFAQLAMLWATTGQMPEFSSGTFYRAYRDAELLIDAELARVIAQHRAWYHKLVHTRGIVVPVEIDGGYSHRGFEARNCDVVCVAYARVADVAAAGLPPDVPRVLLLGVSQVYRPTAGDPDATALGPGGHKGSSRSLEAVGVERLIEEMAEAGVSVKHFVTDADTRVGESILKRWPRAERQLCMLHVLRNIRTGIKDRATGAADAEEKALGVDGSTQLDPAFPLAARRQHAEETMRAAAASGAQALDADEEEEEVEVEEDDDDEDEAGEEEEAGDASASEEDDGDSGDDDSDGGTGDGSGPSLRRSARLRSGPYAAARRVIAAMCLPDEEIESDVELDDDSISVASAGAAEPAAPSASSGGGPASAGGCSCKGACMKGCPCNSEGEGCVRGGGAGSAGGCTCSAAKCKNTPAAAAAGGPKRSPQLRQFDARFSRRVVKALAAVQHMDDVAAAKQAVMDDLNRALSHWCGDHRACDPAECPVLNGSWAKAGLVHRTLLHKRAQRVAQEAIRQVGENFLYIRRRFTSNHAEATHTARTHMTPKHMYFSRNYNVRARMAYLDIATHPGVWRRNALKAAGYKLRPGDEAQLAKATKRHADDQRRRADPESKKRAASRRRDAVWLNKILTDKGDGGMMYGQSVIVWHATATEAGVDTAELSSADKAKTFKAVLRQQQAAAASGDVTDA